MLKKHNSMDKFLNMSMMRCLSEAAELTEK